MGEDAVQPPEDVDEVLDANILALRVGEDDKSAREQLLIRDNVGGPVERVTAVVDGAAALRLFVHGTEELPLRGAHLGTCTCAARRSIEEKADD